MYCDALGRQLWVRDAGGMEITDGGHAGIRAKDHQSYIQLIIWLLFGGR